jgi:hypothetical protein
VTLLPVPYKGSAAAALPVVGREVNPAFDTIASAATHIRSGEAALGKRVTTEETKYHLLRWHHLCQALLGMSLTDQQLPQRYRASQWA